ncbi:MAG: hypothetical protein JRE70_08020, partial [Deltaproteobacteria bacterium]|nr:hypothetical protein [Deltaproteobacteria bacterium]
GDRYEGLSIPENGAAYEMVSQIANLLKSSSSENPIPSDYSVKRIFHAGQSQQGGSMITYASSFHFPINDGYFVQAASSARSINSVFPACGSEGADPYPGCTPRLEGDDRRVRTDLPVPVYRALTETDVSGAIRSDARQEDTHDFRYYEVAGVTHMTVHVGVELIPAGILGPDPLLLEDACMNPFNTLADGPVFGSHIYNAMWQNMVWQSRWGVRPPHGELIETTVDENGDPIIARDAFDNAIGGIRPAGIAVPVATYLPNNELADSIPDPLRPLLGLACRLGGSVFPFDEETIDELYPTHRRYVKKVTAQTVRLQFHRFMLWEDAHAVREEADASGIGGDDPACGRGHEVALILPPLVFLGRRRRRARAGDAVPS